MTGKRLTGRNRERGAIAMLAALLVMVLGGFLALSLDVGHKFTAKAQLESAVDSGSVAGAGVLDGTAAGVTNARDAATRFATLHYLDKTPITIDSENDVTLGYWRKSDNTFYPSGSSVTIGDGDTLLDPAHTPQYFNAVKVLAGADGQAGHNNRTDVLFGAFVGYSGGLASQARGTAVAGGPCDEDGNVLPLAVTSCALSDGAGSTMCDQTVQLSFNWDNGRDVAFADITISDGSNRVGDEEVQDQIRRAIEGRAPTVNTFQPLAITGGSGGGAARDPFSATTLNMFPVCTNASPATCQAFLVPVINVGSTCSDHMPDHAKPVGFAQVSIRGRQWDAAGRSINLYINCVGTSSSVHQVGCPNFGFRSEIPARLIKPR